MAVNLKYGDKVLPTAQFREWLNTTTYAGIRSVAWPDNVALDCIWIGVAKVKLSAPGGTLTLPRPIVEGMREAYLLRELSDLETEYQRKRDDILRQYKT